MRNRKKNFADRVATVDSDDPELIRTSIVRAMEEKLSCECSLFFKCRSIDDNLYYSDMAISGEDSLVTVLVEQNGASAKEAPWMPSRLERSVMNRFIRIESYYSEEELDIAVNREVMDPLEVGDQLRAVLFDGSKFLGWIGYMRRGKANRFRKDEEEDLNAALPALRSALAAADSLEDETLSDGLCAVFTPEGDLEHASEAFSRWVRPSWRGFFCRWVRDLDAGNETRLMRPLGGAEVRLVRMDGSIGVRYLATVSHAALMRVDPREWLTSRQQQIAEFAAHGATAREIGEHLEISPATVRTHLKNIYRRLDIASRTELTEMLRGVW